jgi:two-component sensor histidine kinase
VVLGVDRATFLGLALAELLTNAFKHAIPAGTGGTVRVTLRADGDWLEAEVADDGPGLPTDLDPDTVQSMGMTILGGLTAQMRGSLEFFGPPGTRAVLRVPREGAGGPEDARRAGGAEGGAAT